MAVRNCAILLVACAGFLAAQTNDPFAYGYDMGCGGTILQADHASGRQPWIPAAFMRDTARFGVAAAGVDYYDAMDNFTASRIMRAATGFWLRTGPVYTKAAYSCLSALGMYREHYGFLSAGAAPVSFFSASAQLSFLRKELTAPGEHRAALFAFTGAAAMYTGKAAALSVSARALPLVNSHDAAIEMPMSFAVGIHTTHNRFGAQGVVCEAHGGNVRFFVGEEYRITPALSVSAAAAANPFMLHFGVAWRRPDLGGAFSLVNHPVLGWSRGLHVEHVRRSAP